MFIQEDYDESVLRLAGLIEHYRAENSPLGIERLEHEIVVPIPRYAPAGRTPTATSSRCSSTPSSSTRRDRTWIVEFKLRKQLSALQQVTASRQIRVVRLGLPRGDREEDPTESSLTSA